MQLPQTGYHYDPIDNPLAEKFYGRIPLTYAMALYYFRRGGHVQKLVHTIKYAHQPDLGYVVGRLYGSQLVANSWPYPFNVIMPVPLHPRRLRQRGYNQSACFAQGLSDSLYVPCTTQWLERIKYTDSQTAHNKLGRLQQLVDAFYIGDATAIKGQHVLLVDDVVTTGATIEACVLALVKAGVQAVSLAAIAVKN